MGNIGSEISRALNWQAKNNPPYMLLATDRALELLDLTIADPKNLRRGKELWRVREAIADYFYGNNEFRSTPRSWRDYFDAFAYAANRGRF